MIKIVICDDNEVHRNKTRTIVLSAMHRLESDIICYDNSQVLLQDVIDGRCLPDIAVLDINMDDMDGIALAKRINEIHPACKIIFLSAYLSYAQDVYNAEHIWFILKQDAELRMGAAISKAVALVKQERGGSTVLIKTDDGPKLVKSNEIIRVERSGLKTCIVCTDRTYTAGRAPSAVIESLPDILFIRCTQSCWVSMNAIDRMDKDRFCLINGDSVSISRTYRAEAKQIYIDNL